MESVQIWFNNGCKYLDGVALYAALPAFKPALLKMFNKGESALNKEKLKYELKKVSGSGFKVAGPSPAVVLRQDQNNSPKVKPVINPVTTKEAGKLPPGINKTFLHELPEPLRDVYLEATELFRKNCALKVALNELKPEQVKEALAIQLEIHRNRKRNEQCWGEIDYYKSHKKLLAPAVPEKGNYSPAELVKKQQNLFSSISRLKKRLDENIKQLGTATTVQGRTKLQKGIERQQANILGKQKLLFEVNALIEKKDE